MTEIFRAARDDSAERAELDRLAFEGLLRPLIADLYVRAGDPDRPELRVAALRLLLPVPVQDGGAVIGLEAAAWLLTGGSAPEAVDVLVGTSGGRRPFPWLRLHEIRPDPRDVETVGRLRSTGPARTAADLCRSRPTDVALAHLDRLHAATGVTPSAVRAVLDRLGRHPGVRHGRDVTDLWQARRVEGGP